MYINLANIDFGGEGGGKAVLQETTIESLLTETTKVVTPPEGVDGFNKVTVTHAPVETLTEATITSNGETTITPSAGFDATFGVKVVTNVPSSAIYTGSKEWIDSHKFINIYIDGNKGIVYDTYATPLCINPSDISYDNIYDSSGNQITPYQSPDSGGTEIYKRIFVSSPEKDIIPSGTFEISDYLSGGDVLKYLAGYDSTYGYTRVLVGNAMFISSDPIIGGMKVDGINPFYALVISTSGSEPHITAMGVTSNQESIVAVSESFVTTGVGAIYNMDDMVLYAGNTNTLMILNNLKDERSKKLRSIVITDNILSAPDIPNGITSVGSIIVDDAVTSYDNLLKYTSIKNYESFPILDKASTVIETFRGSSIETTEGFGIVFPNVTNTTRLFLDCPRLTHVTNIFGGSLANTTAMFNNCRNLISIDKIDLSNVYDASVMFSGCGKLTNLGGFIGLKVDFSLSDSPLLTHDSLLNVINEAADVTASPKTLTLGETNLAKLTDEEKAIATSKGWTLA